MNNFQQTARVGLFFVLGLALTWVTFQTLSGGKIFKEDHLAWKAFASAVMLLGVALTLF